MSVLATVAPTVVPTVAPVVTPVVHAVVTVHSSITDTLNQLAGRFSSADLLVAAGALATGLQYLINRFANVRKFTNQILGLVIPFLVVAPTVIDGFKASNAVAVYAVAQLLYYLVEKLKDSVKPVAEPVQL